MVRAPRVPLLRMPSLAEHGSERCVGCDALAFVHPWVGIGWPVGFPPVGLAGVIQAHPVCDACYRDPAHRQRILKVHFFPREQKVRALALAGGSSIGG